ncbi:NDP-hexose 2,3-dehydratase family protein [Nonomuraea sp. NPDC050643]|uniref:NDP-hexose 2,3-dehydratase family protein n=1 Tax=Nonomuraea sp. NPDC050643 TaxID=3155660 RepID=UPI0033C09780
MLSNVQDVPAAASRLRPRQDAALAERLARSAAAREGAHGSTEDFRRWFAERAAAHRYRVDRIPFAELDRWSFEATTGNLVHSSGRFFTLEGLHATVDHGPFREWHQPIIKQPEVGILGILVKEFDGVLHFLMQAKMEPGNPNLVQLSPTVQATRSNYMKVHQGSDVRYLEYFTATGRGRVVADVLQSEHGSWFYRKANRNMIVEAADDVPPHEDFHWLTLGQIGALLHDDNLVNMDSRTVLSCAPTPGADEDALDSDIDLLSWITAERSRHDVRTELVPLATLPGWVNRPFSIDHEEGLYFSVVAVSVHAANREVTSWTQPLIEPRGHGVAAFLTRRLGGVPHVLVQARVEGGFLDTIELGPTVQCVPSNYTDQPGARPPFLDLVETADPARIRYEAVHSEEGGRFLNAESRYLVIETDDGQTPLTPPPGFRWVSHGQLTSLVRHSHYVNVQARTLLACLNAMSAAA